MNNTLKLLMMSTLLAFIYSISVIDSANSSEQVKSISEKDIKANSAKSRTEKLKEMLTGQTAKPLKSIRIQIKELKDNSGLVYIGAAVYKADLSPFLAELKSELKEEFIKYRQNQASRDHQQFHLTLINPYEYQNIDSLHSAQLLKIDQHINVSLLGLGKASKENKTTFFVVAQSPDAKFYRQQFILPNKDFHITLGFEPQDVYGVSKGVDTLISPDK